jgi:hypothetical protein
MAFDHLKFPFVKYHPVLGERTAKTQEDLDKVFVGPEHNWFDTPEEADMHRTAAEAEMVRHNSTRMRVDTIVSQGDPDGEAPDLAEQVDIGTVVNSVQHHEYVVKPILNAPTDEERQAEAERIDAAAQKRQADLARESDVVVEATPASHVESSAG